MEEKMTKLVLWCGVAILALAFFMPFVVNAKEKENYFKVNQLYYHVIGKQKVELCGAEDNYKGSTLWIPEKVTYKKKSYKVTRTADLNRYYQDIPITKETVTGANSTIDVPGFHNYQYEKAEKFPIDFSELAHLKVKKIVIPKTITYIGEGSFSCCENLETVQFAKKYKKLIIGANVFGVNKMKKIVVPSGTVELKDGALGVIKQIELPASVKKIGAGVVNGSTQKVTVKGKHFKWCEGALYTQNMKTLIGVSAKASTAFSLPAKTEKIGRNAFAGTKVKSVTLHGKITEIPEGAFYSCRKLKTVSGVSDVTRIGYAAFDRCSNLQQVGFMPNLVYIDRAAFWSAANVKLCIPAKLENIDLYAFAGTYHCGRQSISVENGNEVFSIENNFLMKKDGGKKIVVAQLTTAGDVVVPEGVTDIPISVEAEEGLTLPTTLERQDGVVRVNGHKVFYKCTKVPVFGEDYFISGHVKNRVTIVVPKGCQDAYFKAIVEVLKAREVEDESEYDAERDAERRYTMIEM